MDCSRYKGAFLHLGLVVAKLDIARHWKDIASPSLAEWRRGMDDYVQRNRSLSVKRVATQTLQDWAEYRVITIAIHRPPPRNRNDNTNR